MTRQEALTRISELSCSYHHLRMTECPHCAEEVEYFIKMLIKEGSVQEEVPEERYDCPIHGLQDGPDCPRC